MDRKRLGIVILTAAMVIVLGWFGIEKLRNPLLWVGFLPLWSDGLFGVDNDVWVTALGILELLFALLLVIPVRRVRQAGALIIALHLGFVVWQVGWNDVGVRDLGLLLSSLALLVLI